MRGGFVMTSKESILERKFFDAFFSTLAAKGVKRIISWGAGSEEVRLRFLRSYRALEWLRSTHEDVETLVDILRPCPLSGWIEPFERRLIEHGSIWLPQYHYVELSAHKEHLVEVPHLQLIIEALAETYLAPLHGH